jgi:uncharacterized protein (TIGR02117 family)
MPSPRDVRTAQAVAAGPGTTVVVIDHGWHTDIALAAADVTGPAAAVAAAFPGARFLEFSFGDRAFYMAREESVWLTLDAMFPAPGVILVTGLAAPPEAAYGADRVARLSVTCRGLDGILAFLDRALATRAGATPQAIGAGPYAGSEFYASDETYDLLRDCNRWTLEALRQGGLPVDPDGVILAGQAMAQVRQVAAAQETVAAASGCGAGAAAR